MPATLHLTVGNTALLADLHAYFVRQVHGAAGELSAAVTATDETIQVNQLTPNTTPKRPFPGVQPAPLPLIAVGSCVLIDQEPMTVTAIEAIEAGGHKLTVSRGAAQATATGSTVQFPIASPAAHNAGAQVLIAKYPSVWEMIHVEAIQPYEQRIIAILGPASAGLSGNATGSVSA